MTKDEVSSVRTSGRPPAREGLKKLQEMIDVPGFGAAVEMLKGGIKYHVEEEETELQPELKEGLERAAWLALGDSLVAAKKAAGLPIARSAQRRSTKRKPTKAKSTASK